MKVKMKRPLCLVCLLFVLTIFLYMEWSPLPAYSPGDRAGKTLQLTGQVERKEIKNDKYVIYLKHVTFCNNEKFPNIQPNNASVVCYFKEIPEENKEPKMGAYVKICGKVQEFSIATNPGEFDLKRYYRTLGYDFLTKNTVLIGETQEYDYRLETLYQIRKKLASIYDRALQGEDAAMMKAMVLGDKQDLEQESKELFQKAGIAHILAISGLHISLLGMGLFKLLRKGKMPVVAAAFIAVIFMIQFGDMTGMSSSAMRAIFMFACRLVSKIFRRSYDLLSAMVTSCILLLLEQPLYIYHTGFLLSFGAIMGIGIMEPIWTDGMERVKNKKGNYTKRFLQKIWLAFLGSMGIFAFQVPIILCSYYELSPYSFLLNLFVIPLMGCVMLLGILILLFGLLLIPLACIPGMGIHLILGLFTASCHLVLQLPAGIWIAGKPETWQLVVYCMVLILIILLQNWIPKWMLGVWFMTAVSILTIHVQTGLRITMLDVGQGDGIVISSETGHHYMIDGGSSSKKNLGKYQIIPYLKSKGIHQLDAVFLTHLDQDHIAGIEELLLVQEQEKIFVKSIILAKEVIKDEAYDKLITICEEQKVPVQYISQGDYLEDDNLKITCLFPYPGFTTEDRNDASLVLDVTSDSFAGLFTGDAGTMGEAKAADYIMEYMPDKKYQLFKATHHGSKNSNTEKLLSVISPSITLISCGKDNDYGHPHMETLKRLDETGSIYYRTDESGAITMVVEEHKYTISRFLIE